MSSCPTELWKCLGKHSNCLRKAVWIVGGGLLAAVVVKKVVKMRRAAAIKSRREQQKPDIVYLTGFGRAPGLLNLSPPCLKAETYLRIAKIPYVINFSMDTNDSPTQRFPFIELNGEATCDSQFIIERVQKHFQIKENLTLQQHARGVAVRRLCEDSLRLSYYRYLFVDNLDFVITNYTKMFEIPYFAAYIFMKPARKRTIAMLNMHGHGDLTHDEYHTEFYRDVQTIETFLTDSPYIVGKEVSQYDAVVFGALYNIIKLAPSGCKAVDFVKNNKVLNAYVERMLKQFYPDEATITQKANIKVPSQSFIPA